MRIEQFIADTESLASVLENRLANPLEVREELERLEKARRRLFQDNTNWGGFQFVQINGCEYVALRCGKSGNLFGGWLPDTGMLPRKDERELQRLFAAVLRSWAGRARSILAAGVRPTRPGKGKNVNANMLTKIQNDPTARGWTCTQWAKFLKCSTASVTGTETWKQLRMFREELKAAKAADRRSRTSRAAAGHRAPRKPK